jgi:hypothetical protein
MRGPCGRALRQRLESLHSAEAECVSIFLYASPVEEEYRRQVEDEDYEYLLSVEAALDRDCDFCDFRYTSTPPP